MFYRTAAFSMTSNDPNLRISRSGLSLTLYISEMTKDTAIVTMEGELETVPKLSNGTTFNDLE